ncbi:MAG: YifB family Mg chelatase-like AAA ATPase, partial [Clostridia bacterium]|nr:YifB family Mg chelatase-like AAA ATPase [Clostridia bacterium]
MVAAVNSVGYFGMKAFLVRTETDISAQAFRFDIVGLPDAAVKEAKDRVQSALLNSGLQMPYDRVLVNLAPANVRKEGSMYDLSMLLSLLIATHQLRGNFEDAAFIGELSLSGEICAVNGVLPMTLFAKESGLKRIFVPAENAPEASVIAGIEVFAVTDVRSLVSFLRDPLNHTGEYPRRMPSYVFGAAGRQPFPFDFSDVKGQSAVKRAREIAAAGGHNVLMCGAPGAGKSMLAKRLPSILPDMSFEEALETTKIYSVAGLLDRKSGLVTVRPFRAPHHTGSLASLAGGGTVPKPGELSLAHNGVLFLDELPEFPRASLEILRQPLENGEITLTRVAGTVTYPCSIMLVGAMNPCPCGYRGHPTIKCTCAPGAAERYLARISGPMMDRIDIQVEVEPVRYEDLIATKPEESSAEIKRRVDAARAIQRERFKDSSTECNAKMTSVERSRYCVLSPAAEKLLSGAFERLSLSARAYDKILKLSRTIADL